MEDSRSLKTTSFLGDCLEVLKELPDNFVSSVVTDPPAGIAFMNKGWDTNKGGRNQWVAWLADVMREVKRVLKPGGHMLVWALPRTSHWTATAIEDAGFEVRDIIHHLFSSGMPKNLDLGRYDSAWAGWGTALKPAAEHWILARKPLAGATVAQNAAQHATGALHIDAARVGGRWPANAVLTTSADEDSPDVLLDRQSGHTKSKRSQRGKVRIFDKARYGVHETGWLGESTERGFNDEGGASRFFMRFIYCSKASPAERGDANNHPTVKGGDLMQYLVLLITPPGGRVLDPFMGSGSTGVACVRQGFEFIGIEQDEQYYTIACHRIAEAQQEHHDKEGIER